MGSGTSRAAREACGRRRGRRGRRDVLTDRRGHRRRRRKPGPPAPTSRAPPFTAARFHVLLNSLFKVLFNFPSRYLFAIGLGVVLSLTWSLPRASSCTPKQLDSGERVGAPPPPPYGPITLRGRRPLSRWTWAGGDGAMRPSLTPHSPRPRGPGVRRWAVPGSFAITEGITVVFFSSAY